RALPARAFLPHTLKTEGEALLALEIMAAPQLSWQELVTVRVHKAVDDQGQALKEAAPCLGDDANGPESLGEVRVWIEGASPVHATPGGGTRQAAVRLKLGTRPAVRITELHGTITAEVLGRDEPLMAIDNVLKGSGREARGPEGCSLKLLDVKQEKG